jgi:hypothetical protein
LKQLLEEFKLHSYLQLNEVQSKDKLEADIKGFFSHQESSLLIISVNPLVDSQRRLDLCISIINKVRL